MEKLYQSQNGVDYNQLDLLLALEDWREADKETTRVMCLAVGREKEGCLEVVDINNFPCKDLHTINQLWLHYSNGKLGFSVQKEIYESLGGTREYNPKIWRKFCDQVGWRVKGRWINYVEERWINYDELTFNLSIPSGHLPLDCVFIIPNSAMFRDLFFRTKTCNL
ncbi:GUN4 domain-containing protein [Planktothrix sp. FACHB-1365]|uniref:GUN4 domain-containing protein n=1 Tax=Planktothrix sp. FACHB-1365 TaxID=2692855 RepID=UPI001687B12D|nr:GUN4 domain-containing protein [Planktothrix sp. FACHB-1365]MBD2481000.1 GUN4 domain-containing protein [Planktothrix sp. FACHB-1365]